MEHIRSDLVLTICGTIFVVFKFADYFIKKRNDGELLRKLSPLFSNIQASTNLAQKLWDIHNRYDDDGAPLWYVPRSWATTQEKMIATMQQIAETQREIARTLEQIEKRQFRERHA